MSGELREVSMIAGLLHGAVLVIRHARDLLRDQGENAIADELAELAFKISEIADNI